MKNWKVVNYLIIIFILISLLSGCSECNNEIIKKENSPDGNFVAVIFIRDCGATTDFSYQVSILNKDSQMNNLKGNVFITENVEITSVKWNSIEELTITYKSNKEEIFKMENSIYGIKVNYIKE